MASDARPAVAEAADVILRDGTTLRLRAPRRDDVDALVAFFAGLSERSRYLRFIENFYRREFIEVFMQPKPNFGLLREIVGILAGNVFTRDSNPIKLALFFLLVRLQALTNGGIAPRIAWERLPEAASM